MRKEKHFFKNSWQKRLGQTRKFQLKTTGSLRVKKMKRKTGTERNKNTNVKVTRCLIQGLNLIAMRNKSERKKAHQELKKEKRIAKEIVNHAQIIHRKTKSLEIIRTVIGLEDIAALTMTIKLN